ncbi:unnamed protein product [Periconia digitata]|uniref:Uncharacterized protein n=1 Tax=Periconia digitata TaxID=1303443 RepID=A0A9W4U925_9PLEO|nr:unnamed protein product [Periconia digitata]
MSSGSGENPPSALPSQPAPGQSASPNLTVANTTTSGSELTNTAITTMSPSIPQQPTVPHTTAFAPITPAPATPAAASTPSTNPATAQSASTPTPTSMTSNTAQRVTPSSSGCPTEKDKYMKISVHTAKCSVCDKRNGTTEMLRCPLCSWEICHPCQQIRERDGNNPIGHGKVGVSGVTRRITFSRTPIKKAGGGQAKIPASSPLASAAAYPNAATGKEGTPHVTKHSKKNAQPEGGKDVAGNGKKRMAAVDEPAPSSSPSTGESRNVRIAATNKKAAGVNAATNLSSDTDSEVDYMPKDLVLPGSPAMSNKRLKVDTAASSRSKRMGGVLQLSEAALQADRAAPAAHANPYLLNPANNAYQSVAEDRRKVREHYGPLLDGYSNEGHLLARRMPVMSNPTDADRLIEDGQRFQTIREFVFEKVRNKGITLTQEQGGYLLYPVCKFLENAVSPPNSNVRIENLPTLILGQKEKDELTVLVIAELKDIVFP